MNFSRLFRHVSNITSRLSHRQYSNLPKVEENETDKLFKIMELELKGHDPAVLKSFVKFATTAGNHLDVQSKSWSLRKPIHDRRSVLKSVHIYKKHQVQYETRTYFNFIQFKHLTGSTADTLLEYIERNLPEGVALKATKVELQTLPEHLKSP
ncbi:small ribosomal subunit protein uS10m [Tribolium castaneum]|uniref:Small ribosomal subunit protein uS10m n=1 Tax=Tribolium castaneum TaxID=7070 RepID=D2A2W1_TRICA|nr:PREDICTED: 28S ribosomal protein S10, mitochondrial [Tribolium castaneum]EFA02227.2 28S ribosomal protein S10, mitochondrial-like Protein [Tribolium castaneum]|eukprot:XP_008191820.1 PREDICTED: 28S ribosomal protein S10, mitochondrial [Tribolium castaneum]